MDELVHLANNVGVSPLVGVPDHGIGVSSLDLRHDLRTICSVRFSGTPEYTARGDVREQKRQARSDTRSSGDDDNLLEQLGGVEKTVEGSTTYPQLSLVGLHDLLLGPVTSVTDHDAETVDLTGLRVSVRDGGESVPLSQRLVADLKTVERCHTPVLEVKTGGVVTELLRVHGAVAQTRPGSNGA